MKWALSFLLLALSCAAQVWPFGGGSVVGVERPGLALFNGAPSGLLPRTTAATTLTLDSTEPARVRYSATPGLAFASIPTEFAVTGGTNHSTPVSGLVPGETYAYFAKATNGLGAVTPDDFVISFEIALENFGAANFDDANPKSILPAGTTSAEMSVRTDKVATVRAGSIGGTPYPLLPIAMSTVDGLVHTSPLTGLTNGGFYNMIFRGVTSTGITNQVDFGQGFSVDVDAPTNAPTETLFSDGRPTGVLPAGILSANVRVTTDKAAVVKASLTPNTPYASMAITFTTTGGLEHTNVVSGLVDGGSYTYYLKAADSIGDFVVSFAVSPATGAFFTPTIANLTDYANGYLSPGVPDTTIQMPLEVFGGNTTDVAVVVPSPGKYLWLKLNNVSWPGKLQLKINNDPVMGLANSNVFHFGVYTNFGGIGGYKNSFTVRLLTPLPTTTTNLQFSFWYLPAVPPFTAKASSGYRVLDMDLRDVNGQGARVWTWPTRPMARPWFTNEATINEGSNLWHTAALTEFWNGPAINASCADCHGGNGRDLKYFGYSRESMVERSVFHGIDITNSAKIANYLLALPEQQLGRPWNPPYQPAPTIESVPIYNWAAGAGLDWVLTNDMDSWNYAFPTNSPMALNFEVSVNKRIAPIALALPDWNQWLPDMHEKDMPIFAAQPQYASYTNARNTFLTCTPENFKQRESSFYVNQSNVEVSAAGPLDYTSPHDQFKVLAWRNLRFAHAWNVLHRLQLEDDYKTYVTNAPYAVDRAWPTRNDYAFSTGTHLIVKSPWWLLSPQVYTNTPPRDGFSHTFNHQTRAVYYAGMVLNDGNSERANGKPNFTEYGLAFADGIRVYMSQGQPGSEFESFMWLMSNAENGTGRCCEEPPNQAYRYSGSYFPRSHMLFDANRPKVAYDNYPSGLRNRIYEAWFKEYVSYSRPLGVAHYIANYNSETTGVETNVVHNVQSILWQMDFCIKKLVKYNCDPAVIQGMIDMGEEFWPQFTWSTLGAIP